MPLVNELHQPELYRKILSQNLHRQIILLMDSVSIGLETNFKIDVSVVLALHSAATTYLLETPGQYRTGDVSVTYSTRLFPPAADVSALMGDLMVDLHKRWPQEDAISLAARALWRLTWIHPFADANGRTARALAQYILCVKYGRWLPGDLDILQMLKNDHVRYVRALQVADDTEARGEVDLSLLKELMLDVLESQVSAHPSNQQVPKAEFSRDTPPSG